MRLKRWAYYVTLLMTLLIALIIVSPYIISNVPDTLEDIVIAVFVGEYHIYWVLFFAFYLSGASWASFSTMWLFIVVIYVLLLAFLLHPHIRKAFGITRFLR
ncbi:MAG: hypothetical protein GTN76_00115 [Candidatus Aenigmarchaeota archaeon]|nr:hypothetical protein [Candidatus Aenigmarchaeota archaeon]